MSQRWKHSTFNPLTTQIIPLQTEMHNFNISPLKPFHCAIYLSFTYYKIIVQYLFCSIELLMVWYETGLVVNTSFRHDRLYLLDKKNIHPGVLITNQIYISYLYLSHYIKITIMYEFIYIWLILSHTEEQKIV